MRKEHRKTAGWVAALMIAFLVGYLSRGVSENGAVSGEESGGNGERGAGRGGGGIASKGSGRGGSSGRSVGSKGAGGGPSARESRPAGERFVEALREADSLDRFRKVALALEGMSVADVEEAIEGYRSEILEGRHYQREVRDLMRRLGKLDGKAALERRQAGDPDAADKRQWTFIMSGWASAEPAEAAAWMENLENPEFKSRLVYGLIEGLAQADLEVANEVYQSLPPEERSGSIDTMMWYHLHEGGFGQLAEWYETVPTEVPDGPQGAEEMAYGRRVFDRMTTRLIENGPAPAAEWIAENVDSPFATGSSVRRVARTWADQNAEAVLDWVTGLRTDRVDLIVPGLEAGIHRWASQEMGAVGEWLGRQEGTPHYDAATELYAERLRGLDPEGARRWAETIRNGEIRGEVLRNLAEDR